MQVAVVSSAVFSIRGMFGNMEILALTSWPGKMVCLAYLFS